MNGKYSEEYIIQKCESCRHLENGCADLYCYADIDFPEYEPIDRNENKPYNETKD